MQRLLLALLLLAPAGFSAQDNPNYDPDYDGDGCYSVADILGLLPLFGSCVDTTPAFPCGDSVLFDSYWYETVLIGDQCWFAENLRTTVYANGDLIPSGLTDGEWSSTTAGASTVYGEGSSNCYNDSPDIDACDEAQSLEEYGRLYNWYAVDDDRGLCPNGWQVPTDGEWTELEDYIASQGFAGTEGTALKSTLGWSNNGNGTDQFGFAGLPGGDRWHLNGSYFSAGTSGVWWSSSSANSSAWRRRLFVNQSHVNRAVSDDLRNGFSVRCLLDAPLQGCTDSSYIEFNPSAALDDGSCLTPLAPGCTDSLYVEFDLLANVDDGSCSTLASTCSEVEMDGYTYSVVEIGDQCWFAENLRTTVYANGDLIPAGLTHAEWTSATTGATAVYGEDGFTCDHESPEIDACDETQSLATYGRLYNWYAVDDTRGLCPTGWHVPTDGEWTELEDFITLQGFSGIEGTALKSTTGWAFNQNGTDPFGFSALPGGSRGHFGSSFSSAGLEVFWWSSSPNDGFAWTRTMVLDNPELSRGYANLRHGYSVRCLKD